jgi:glutamate synthase (NADPH/NADH) small chain
MSEYNRSTKEKEFDKNFAQKKSFMNSTEAFYESSWCLFSYIAPCLKTCTTNIDIPLFIKQIQTGNTNGLAATIYETNWGGKFVC